MALLLHEPGRDLDAWGTAPAALAARLGGAVIAVDLPGHGLSDDPWEPDQLPALIAALAGAFAALDGPGPALVAAGAAARSAIAIAATVPVAAVVALSADAANGVDVPGSPGVPKLFLAGALDGDAVARARRLANLAGGWAIVGSTPTGERGTGLLGGEWAPVVLDQIAAFLADARSNAVRQGRPMPRHGDADSR